jgi:hypothetical protein
MPRLTDQCAGEVRVEMAKPGFALVDRPSFFDDELFLRLQRNRTVLAFNSKRWWRFPQLARYGCWLEGLLQASLPEEAVSLASLEFRHEQAGTQDSEVDNLHADGGYIRTVYTLFGESTIYRHAGIERPVPDGQTLLLTAQNRTRALRIPCTLHRRPGGGSERAVIVCSFEPRLEQGQMADVYRQVVQKQSPRRRE